MYAMKEAMQTFKKPWARCLGSDRVSTMLRAEYWEDFDRVRDVLGVEYIRCHGLLEDDLGLVRRPEYEGKKELVFNFAYLDRIFDTMKAHGVRPYIEWGFMPSVLASGTQTIFWWKGNVTPPADWKEWALLLSTLVTHWITRYGLEEVRRWPMEIWNEPNLPGFWQGADKQAYFKLYETSVKAIKAVDEGIEVGGPAICGGNDQWIDDFLDYVSERKLPLDFVTRHLYCADKPTKVTPDYLYQPIYDVSKPLEELASVRKRIDAKGYAALPFHITEFNTSYNPRCPVHDTPFNAAYLAGLLAEAGKHVELMSYWTFTDVFEEIDIPRPFFHGGFGLLGRGGVAKPTFHLFAFMDRLEGEIIFQSPHAIATRRPDGSIAIVAWNPCGVADPVHEELEERRMDILIPAAPSPLLVLRKRVSDHFANPWDAWRSMGRPSSPTADQLEHIRLASSPVVETSVLKGAAGEQKLPLVLGRNEITLLELTPFVDESPSYKGLDDSLINGY